MEGFVIFFAKGEVGGSQTWCKVLVFAKEAAGFYFGYHRFPSVLSIRLVVVIKERSRELFSFF